MPRRNRKARVPPTAVWVPIIPKDDSLLISDEFYNEWIGIYETLDPDDRFAKLERFKSQHSDINFKSLSFVKAVKTRLFKYLVENQHKAGWQDSLKHAQVFGFLMLDHFRNFGDEVEHIQTAPILANKLSCLLKFFHQQMDETMKKEHTLHWDQYIDHLPVLIDLSIIYADNIKHSVNHIMSPKTLGSSQRGSFDESFRRIFAQAVSDVPRSLSVIGGLSIGLGDLTRAKMTNEKLAEAITWIADKISTWSKFHPISELQEILDTAENEGRKLESDIYEELKSPYRQGMFEQIKRLHTNNVLFKNGKIPPDEVISWHEQSDLFSDLLECNSTTITEDNILDILSQTVDIAFRILIRTPILIEVLEFNRLISKWREPFTQLNIE